MIMVDSNRPQPLGDVLEEVIEQLGLQDKMDEARVIETWAAVAGPDVNGVTESVWMNGATLYVKITSATWRQELHMNRGRWRERLNDELDAELVDEIVFR
jgi:predicted nucleic acid-binding Zn ribbon protein